MNPSVRHRDAWGWAEVRIETLPARVGVGLLTFTPLIVTPSLAFPYITGKAVFVRWVVAAGILLTVALRFRSGTASPPIPPGRIGWTALALLSAAGLSTLQGADPLRSLFSGLERTEGMAGLVTLAGVWWLIRAARPTIATWQWWLQLSCAASSVVLLVAATDTEWRASSTLGSPTYLGLYAALHAIAALHFGRRAPSALGIAAWSLLAGGLLWTVWITGTRGAIIGTLCGGLAWATLAHDWRQWPIRVVLPAAVFTLAAVGSIAMWIPPSVVRNSPVLTRFIQIPMHTERLTLWKTAGVAGSQRPLLGWGPDALSVAYPAAFDPARGAGAQWLDRAHMAPLDWWVGGGILGLVLYIALFGWAAHAIVAGGKRERSHMAPVMAAWVTYVVHTGLAFPDITAYLLIVGALAFLDGRPTSRIGRAATTDTPSTASVALRGICSVGLALLLTSLGAVVWVQGRAAAVAVSTDAAPSLRRSALERLGRHPAGMGDDVLCRATSIPDATGDGLANSLQYALNAATVRRAGALRLRMAAAHLALVQSRPNAADAHARWVSTTAPNFVDAWLLRHDIAVVAGRPDNAATYAREAARWTPDDERVILRSSEVAWRAGDARNATEIVLPLAEQRPALLLSPRLARAASQGGQRRSYEALLARFEGQDRPAYSRKLAAFRERLLTQQDSD